MKKMDTTLYFITDSTGYEKEEFLRRVEAALRGGVMCHHAVDISGGNEKTEAGTTEFPERVAGSEIRLGEDRNAKTGVFQHAGNDRRAEGRMIHVGVTRYQDEIHLIPSPCFDIFFCHRQKAVLFIRHCLSPFV